MEIPARSGLWDTCAITPLQDIADIIPFLRYSDKNAYTIIENGDVYVNIWVNICLIVIEAAHVFMFGHFCVCVLFELLVHLVVHNKLFNKSFISIANNIETYYMLDIMC